MTTNSELFQSITTLSGVTLEELGVLNADIAVYELHRIQDSQ